MSTPLVPPRPQRTNGPPAAVKPDVPSMPPRPVRKIDPSPDREAFTRSPLNGPPLSSNHRQVRPRASQDLPRRPPSVSLPDIGHEGEEYSSFDQLPDEAHGVSVDSNPAASSAAGEQTRNVSADLPMHQPKASVPRETAKRQIQNVTGTTPVQAAAAGFGKARPGDDVHKSSPVDAAAAASAPLSRVTSHDPKRAPSTEPLNVLRAKASFNRSSSSLQPLERTTSRPASIHGGDDYEHGIPEIGKQVPLLHMAGDVQAPSPGQAHSQHAPGIGFFNDGTGRAHQRKRSSRHEFGPSDAYGLHHSQQDQFEREWARKHPEEAAKEGFYTHLPKPETALSSEQLNRLVHQNDHAKATASPATPDEHGAEEIFSRISSVQQSPASARRKRSSSGSQAQPNLPYRKSQYALSDQAHVYPDDAIDMEEDPTSQRRASRAFEDEHEHEHHEHLHADGTPILAADELLKRRTSAYMHAAVERDPDAYHEDYHYDSDGSRRGSVQPHSRPSSRPSSVHGVHQNYHGGSLHRFVSREEEHHSGMGTPLEEIEEYEPLFPEGQAGDKESIKRIFRKRPELAQHHFPSSDVWEDTPSSLQYSTTVSTPDLEKAQEQLESDQKAAAAAAAFETPEQEQQRRAQAIPAKPLFKPGVADEIHRPISHRFPSSDVWEDSPDSYTLVNQTTVSSPDVEDGPGDDAGVLRPAVPARPQPKSRLAEEMKALGDEDERDVKSPPNVPDKPKVPARPTRPAKTDQLDGASADRSGDASAAAKAKPPVPARPGGEKFGALKAGFMSDLNNRLKLGPQAPPPPKKEVDTEGHEEEYKAPLADARKSRAKGPARRKPAVSPSTDRRSSAAFAFSPLINCWSIDEADELTVHEREEERAAATEPTPPADIAHTISSSETPPEAARQHRGSETELRAALAKAGAAPSSFAGNSGRDADAIPESVVEDEHPALQDRAVQPSEAENAATKASGAPNPHFVYVGGKTEGGDGIMDDGDDGKRREKL